MVGRGPDIGSQPGELAAREGERPGTPDLLATVLDRAPSWRHLSAEQIAGELADLLASWPDVAAVLVQFEWNGQELGVCRPSTVDALDLAPILPRTPGEAVAIHADEGDGPGRTLRAFRVPAATEAGALAIAVVVASARADFPSQREQVLCRAACAQASLAIDAAELRSRLEQADERRDEFLATFGHELRDRLAPILTALALLRMNGRAPDKDRERQREYQIIGRQSTQLAHLVGDLLDLSHLARGRLRLRREPVDLQSAAIGALELLAPLAAGVEDRIDVDIEQGLVVEADRSRLIQILGNLLLRAVRSTENAADIRIRARRVGDGAEVRVIDRGAPIQSERLPHVFDPFTPRPGPPPAPAPVSASREAFGTTLALALVRGLVVLHGGQISASAGAGGQGTEFVIRLPAVPAAVGARPAAERQVTAPRYPGADPTVGLAVLVVDDNADQADSLAMFIEASGMKARVAYSPSQALELADAEPFAIAILDIGLPGMDGYELARKLRRSRHGSRMNLFALTGYGDEADLARSRRAGFRRHFVKPVEGTTLLAALVDEAIRGPRGQA